MNKKQLRSISANSSLPAFDAIIFYSLLALIVLVAIPYGTVQPWWKSAFQCLVFVLAGLSILKKLISRQTVVVRSFPQIVWPILALIVFAFVQTLNLFPEGELGQTLSADPFQTRQFILQLAALFGFGWLLVAHTKTPGRLRLLVDTIIVVGLVSALFGILRSAIQTNPGFGLPQLMPAFGYAQFINTNHFAFLMELALGLALGIVVCRGVSGKRLILYLIAAVPMWVALLLSNSRGGFLGILCQVLLLALLWGPVSNSTSADSRMKLPKSLARVGRNVALRILIVAILFGGVITTVMFVSNRLAERMDDLGVELDRNIADSYTLRPTIWRATWRLIKDHPIAGTGFGGYWIAISAYHEASGSTTPQEAHNDYLELLASGGVIGLAIGFWFAFALIKTAKSKLEKLRTAGASFERAATWGALAGILAVAVHSLVDFGLHITVIAVVFTALVAIVVIGPMSNVQSPTSNVIT